MPSSTVDIATPDGVADAYLTHPDDGARHPGVLFMIDAFGLRKRIEDMADRIASHGYAVLAPNVFYRSGRAPVVPMPDMSEEGARAEFFKKLGPLRKPLTREAIASDGAAYLHELAEVSDGPVAITGYCMGTWLGLTIAAAHPDRVAAVAGFHGGNLVRADDDASPHRHMGSLRAEVYLGYADNDGSATPEQIATFDRALDEAGVNHRSEVYAGAAHGYTMSDTPVYDAEATERHYAALFDLLERSFA
jgi:carboxymethylenebutenolidase